MHWHIQTTIFCMWTASLPGWEPMKLTSGVQPGRILGEWILLWRVRKEKKKQRVIPARYTPYLHFDISPHAYQGSCGSPHSGKEVQRNRRVAQQGTHIRAKNKKGQQKSNTSNEVGSSADAPCAWKVGGGTRRKGRSVSRFCKSMHAVRWNHPPKRHMHTLPLSNPIPKCIQNPEVGGLWKVDCQATESLWSLCYLGKLASKIVRLKKNLTHKFPKLTHTEKKKL